MDIAGQFEKLLEQAIQFIPHLIVALIIFVATLLLSGVAARGAKRVAQRRLDDPEILRLLTWLARWTVIVLGTTVALGQVNFDVTGFVAGLGIAGLTLGFALQDIARNFVAGILLLIRQPFDIGQSVEAGGYGGTVLDITMRDTVLKTWDGEMVILPNMEVFANAILNYSELPLRRRTVQIGLGYGEDVSQTQDVLLKAMQAVDGVLADPAPSILATELGDSVVVLEARFWVNQEEHGVLGVHSAVVKAIKVAAEQEAIDLPYPIQTVRLEGSWPASVQTAPA
jgi:small conductance mechanosensitive channel